MPDTVSCPTCDARLLAPEDDAATTVRCPKCGATLTIPATPTYRAADDLDDPPRPSRRHSLDYDDDEDEDRPRRSRRYEEDDDDDRPSRRRRRGFRCPYCGSDELPITRSRISAAGWVVFALFLVFCFPLFWIGLLITETYRECSDCGVQLGG